MKGSFSEIIQSPVPVVIDAFAEWCGPCKVQSPILKEIASELGNKIRVIKIDVDKNPQVASKFDIRGVPTLMIFKNGDIKYRQAGLHSKPQLMSVINNLL
ncbi:MAG TPA: thioredoxin [Bacteroidales bacterium]|nr:thioredoxin [Bacteroidales bacterium]